jgi:DNA-binding NtrC family response regulator
MDRTLVASPKVEVRGGTLTLEEAIDDVPPLEIGPEPRIIGRRPGCDVVLDDQKVSATHCEVVAAEHGVRLRDLGSTNGTYVGELRVVEALLSKPCTVRCGDTRLQFHPRRTRERVPVSKSTHFGPLVGSTPTMRALFEKLSLLSPTTISVLIEGETGTGKELVARAIHEKSDRAAKPFVVIDCGSIPTGLAESILFGHERGAFTGADSKRTSPFIEASGGTVFLDELGELPMDTQPKLLRVLAEQRIQSVGGNRYVPVNVRIIAATRRDLPEEINKRAFRDDLYFRVAQERVTLPSLRERTDDLAPLVHHMFELEGKGAAFKRVTPESFDRLERHDWPGNVRELRSLVSVALAYDKGSGPIDLGARIGAEAARPRSNKTGVLALPTKPYSESREKHDRAYFTALFEASHGNVSRVGKSAGLSRETVRTYLKALRIAGYGR